MRSRAHDVLVPTVTDKVDGRVLARAGTQLRLIAQFGAGVDNIDLQSATQRGITVTNTPGVLTEDTADMTMALLLAVPRRMVEGVKAIEDGNFTGWTPTWMMGRRITGKRLGIIGMGQSVRPSPAVPAPSACRSIIITASPSVRPLRPLLARPTGKALIRCWRGWTSFRSTARTHLPPITFYRPAGWNSCSRTPSS